MPQSRSKKRIDELTEVLSDVKTEAQKIEENAPAEVEEAENELASLEQQRQNEIDRIHAQYDADRKPVEQKKEEAREARERAKRVAALAKFLDGEIGLFSMLGRLIFA